MSGDVPGKRFGPYAVRGRLGVGGMGTVYAAEHELMGRRAAVKVLLPQFSSNPDMIRRFVNEARSAAAVKHPGIVEIYDVNYTTGGVPYIAMELLEGENLGQRLVQGELPRPAVFAIARQIAAALEAAHRAGVVHRDLKPDNIFIIRDSDGARPRIKLLDFGVAKAIQPTADAQVTQTGVIVGTPSYMAPEQCRGASIDHRADLYALGCVVYRMIAGQAPFRGEVAFDVITAHVRTPAPRLSTSARDVAPALDALVARLLAKAPADRPDTAGELVALFAQLEVEPDVTLPTARVTISEAAPARDAVELMPSMLLQPDEAPVATVGTGPGPATAQPAQRRTPPPIAGTMTLGSGAIERARSVEPAGSRRRFGRIAVVAIVATVAFGGGLVFILGRPRDSVDTKSSRAAIEQPSLTDAGSALIDARAMPSIAADEHAASTPSPDLDAGMVVDPELIELQELSGSKDDSPRHHRERRDAGSVDESSRPSPGSPAGDQTLPDVLIAEQRRADARVAHSRHDYVAEDALLQEAYRRDPRPSDLLDLGDAAFVAGNIVLASSYYQTLVKTAPASRAATIAAKRLGVINGAGPDSSSAPSP